MPLDWYDLNMRSPSGPTGAGSICRGPSYPWAFLSSGNHFCGWNVSASISQSSTHRKVHIHKPFSLRGTFHLHSILASPCLIVRLPQHTSQTCLPVVVILFHATNADGAVATTAATNKTTPRHVDLAPIHAGLGRSHDIPISLAFVILCPSRLD